MGAWLDTLAHAPDGMLAFVAVLAMAALWAGFSGLRRSRHIEDVPTARVRSAPQGYIELVGTAQTLQGEPIIAPLSQTHCCWYRYRVEEHGDNGWRPLRHGTSDELFLLRDATGDCVIDPDGAEVTTAHTRRWSDNGDGWGAHGVHARLPSLGRTSDTLVKVADTVFGAIGGGRYRYTEAILLEGEPLYAIGHFRTIGNAAHSTLHELTGAVLREWKTRPDTLRERFDHNRDGLIDGEEWAHARRVAAREALKRQADTVHTDDVHVLNKPADGRYYLLSNLAEFGLLRRYRWRMRLGFAAFALLASAVALMLSSRW